MSDIRLPQRPIVELPPPIDGLEHVRGEAGRRRRRRAGVVGASLTTAAGVAVVVALSGGSSGFAVLKPAPPAAPGYIQPTPTVTGAVGVDQASHHHRARVQQPTVAAHNAGHTTTFAAGGGHGTDTLPPPSDPAPQPSGRTSRVQEPTLSRWQSTYTGATRECGNSTYGDTSSLPKNALGWCLEVFATSVSNGEHLHVRLCRDSTGGGTVNFSSTREVDFAVQQGGKTVWDWAKKHPGTDSPHQFSEPANGCMNWSLVWPDVTTAGDSAGDGVFTFVGTSTAEELQGNPSESQTFGY